MHRSNDTDTNLKGVDEWRKVAYQIRVSDSKQL